MLKCQCSQSQCYPPGTARAPVFTSSSVVVVGGEAGSHLLTWATLTLYPVVEWELLHRSDQDTCQYH